MAVELFDYCFKEMDEFKYLLTMMSFVLVLFYLSIYGYMYKVDMQRMKIIRQHNVSTEVLRIPKMPHPQYIETPIPVNDAFMECFKYFYKIDKDQKVVFFDIE